MIPELQGKVFEDRPYTILPLAEGKRKDDHFFFKFIYIATDLFEESAVLVVDRDGV